MTSINWHGIYNRKGELLAVEESELQAANTSLNLELNPKSPRNKIFPVMIIQGKDDAGLLELLDLANREIMRRLALPPKGVPFDKSKNPEPKEPTAL